MADSRGRKLRNVMKALPLQNVLKIAATIVLKKKMNESNLDFNLSFGPFNGQK